MMRMNARVRVLRWLIWDTFRQAVASKLFWLMLAVSGLSIMFCLSITVDREVFKMKDLNEDPLGALYGPDGKELTESRASLGKISLGFGLVRVENFRDPRSEVHFVQVILAVVAAGTVGTLLTLIWTGGFLPEFLQPASVSVLLAKPPSRRLLLVGKFFGVMTFVAFQAAVFVFGTWSALGIRTGYWMTGYLWSFPLLLLNFGLIQGASTLLAVCTRNSIACIFGSIVFWGICFGVNYGRHASVALPELTQAAERPQSAGPNASTSTASTRQVAAQSQVARTFAEIAYWTLPKPADLAILLDRACQTDDQPRHIAAPQEFDAVVRAGHFRPVLSVISSLLFTMLMLGLACRELSRIDY